MIGKKKSFLPRIFSSKEKTISQTDEDSFDSSEITVEFERTLTFSATPPSFRKSLSVAESESTSRLGSLNFSNFQSQMSDISDRRDFRIFVATWNVGGKPPDNELNLDDFLRVDDQSDIYVLGFQEIVPLNAGNVLVIEDNEPAAKWLSLINQALNKPQAADAAPSPSTPSEYSFVSQASSTKSLVSLRDTKSPSSLLFFQKSSLKTVSKNFRTERGRRLRTCNCPSDVGKKYKDSCFSCQQAYGREDSSSSEDEELSNNFLVSDISAASSTNPSGYSLIANKQMVGIFVSIWVRKELVQHIGHLRLSCVGRGIMGYLGNKSLGFRGERRRRAPEEFRCCRDTKNTQFQKICKTPGRRIPEKILEHDRIIWLGDLNYRIALSYSETRKLLEDNDWDALLEKDQLKIEREAGRVFKGWNEGKIYFAPTYKYSNNSDAYAGETISSKKKRRTPAWCDRILWHGNGIEQLSYIRGESRFSDHRPVCAVFVVDVGIGRSKRGLSSTNMKVGVEELLPPSSSYMALKNMY